LTASAAGRPVLAADSMAYSPVLAEVAAATPLTRVSSALRNRAALNCPDTADAAAVADAAPAA
jgi:hypothetical protein